MNSLLPSVSFSSHLLVLDIGMMILYSLVDLAADVVLVLTPQVPRSMNGSGYWIGLREETPVAAGENARPLVVYTASLATSRLRMPSMRQARGTY